MESVEVVCRHIFRLNRQQTGYFLYLFSKDRSGAFLDASLVRSW